MERERQQESPALLQGRRLLDTLCLAEQQIPELEGNIKLFPGIDLLQHVSPETPLINGRYGLLVTLDEEGHLPVAQAGFRIPTASNEFRITNSPQGMTREKLVHYPEETRHAISSVLRSGEFRDQLMHGIIRLGKTFVPAGIEKVTAVAAIHHDKVDVNGGPLPLEHAVRVMDALYERHGFLRDESGDFILPLLK